MDLMEYQGKQLFRELDIPTTPEGAVCRSAEEAEAAARGFGVPVVVKAQVKTGGRGKAGGVKLASTPEEARDVAARIVGMDIKGHTVHVVLVEPASDIVEEYYLSVLTDRVAKGYLVICSAQGGVDIEQVNRDQPEAVVKEALLPSELSEGLPHERALDIVTRAALPEPVREDAARFLVRLVDGFVKADAVLFEVNPLLRTSGDRLIALDAKVTLDANALFRHEDHRQFGAIDADDDEQEAEAKRKGIQYIKLDGDVGVIGNGAGLVMATLDVVAQAGGRPADFLDVGGGASAEKMADSLGIVLSDPRVEVVLINIFGGITRGEEVAKGVLGALERLGDVQDKLVVRLDGTNAEEGRAILERAAHPNVIAAKTMDEAARIAVDLAAGGVR